MQLDEWRRSLCCSWNMARHGGAPRASGSATVLAEGRARGGLRLATPDPEPKKDRWEENAGYTPFTLAVAVASLLAAAEIAEACDIETVPALLRDTADAWNEQIEDWIYVEDTTLAREAGVRGYSTFKVAPRCRLQ